MKRDHWMMIVLAVAGLTAFVSATSVHISLGEDWREVRRKLEFVATKRAMTGHEPGISAGSRRLPEKYDFLLPDFTYVELVGYPHNADDAELHLTVINVGRRFAGVPDKQVRFSENSGMTAHNELSLTNYTYLRLISYACFAGLVVFAVSRFLKARLDQQAGVTA